MPAQVTIENPVINSPFDEPRRHFRFTEDGITDEIVKGRRISEYFVPIPRAKKKNPKQLSFETEWTADRLQENQFINQVRERVAIWRRGGYQGITRISGFVYKRVPHVTLKSIANNDEIDLIHEKYQARLDELRAQINAAAGKNWQEWEIPRADGGVRATGRSPQQEYWDLRRERQKEIDASIARRADVELLYDQPYEDNKRIRVAGPFTVESLSPHRVLTTDDPATAFCEDALNTQDFTGMILENLKTAGVQNTIKNERLKFTRLESYAGTWLHATGEYAEKDGTRRRVAVSVGPELGTVSPEQVKEASKEAVLCLGFDLLIVCGFAFDPHVSEEAKRYGRLTVLRTRMNPDLAMGDELLKRTGAGNLFMVFGEPDVEIREVRTDGHPPQLTVTINGIDVYDPTTGEIRSNKTDDIACWFIDTDYSGELFIVRQACFTGVDQAYEKLKRALRVEINETVRSAL